MALACRRWWSGSEDGDVGDRAVGSREDGVEDGDAADASDSKDGDSGVSCSEGLAVLQKLRVQMPVCEVLNGDGHRGDHSV